MDAHQAHPRPLPAGGGGGEGLPVLPQPGQVSKEAEQPLVAGLLELSGTLGQRQQVAPPPLPVSHGAEDPQQVGAVVDLPQKLVAAQLPRQVPQLVQLLPGQAAVTQSRRESRQAAPAHLVQKPPALARQVAFPRDEREVPAAAALLLVLHKLLVCKPGELRKQGGQRHGVALLQLLLELPAGYRRLQIPQGLHHRQLPIGQSARGIHGHASFLHL